MSAARTYSLSPISCEPDRCLAATGMTSLPSSSEASLSPPQWVLFCVAGGSFLKYSNCVFGTPFPGNTHNCIKNQDRKDLDHISAGLPNVPAGNK